VSGGEGGQEVALRAVAAETLGETAHGEHDVS
jgi:hypothetical protein